MAVITVITCPSHKWMKQQKVQIVMNCNEIKKVVVLIHLLCIRDVDNNQQGPF